MRSRAGISKHIEARDLYRQGANITEEEEALRKTVFACATNGRLEFDALCDKVIASLMMRPRG